MSLDHLRETLRTKGNPEKARIQQTFFKTGKGEYAEGDIFLGITVPELRKLSKQFRMLSIPEISILIESPYHEERLLALLILILQYQQQKMDSSLYAFYLEKMQYINNWDLVDVSAPHIPGHYLFHKDKTILHQWAQDPSLWVRRISVISTFYFIRQGRFEETLILCETLLNDSQDLLHKACGWMLREIGKRDIQVLENFLMQHAKRMPRTMLRYAIEKLTETDRQRYLVKT